MPGLFENVFNNGSRRTELNYRTFSNYYFIEKQSFADVQMISAALLKIDSNTGVFQ